jgi:hypothetical protein
MRDASPWILCYGLQIMQGMWVMRDAAWVTVHHESTPRHAQRSLYLYLLARQVGHARPAGRWVMCAAPWVVGHARQVGHVFMSHGSQHMQAAGPCLPSRHVTCAGGSGSSRGQG